MSRQVRIAIAQAKSGKFTVCGPHDFSDYSGPMEAALCWLVEEGEVPTDRFWLTVDLPDPSENEIDLDSDLDVLS